MILSLAWTVLGIIAVVGALRNLVKRRRTLLALFELGINGPARLTAKLFRNSEFIRLLQAVIGMLIGFAAIALYGSPYYRQIQALRASGAFPPTPVVVQVFNAAFQWGMFAWMGLLVFNIYYFGSIGDRVAHLTALESTTGDEGGS